MATPSLRRPEDDIPGYGGPVPTKNGNLPGELSRNINNAANSLGGLGVVASVPLRAANTAAKVASPTVQLAYDGVGPLRTAADFVSGMGSKATTIRSGAQVPTVISRTLPGTNAALQEGAQANVLGAAGRTAAGGNAAAGMMAGSDTGEQYGQIQRPVGEIGQRPAGQLEAVGPTPQGGGVGTGGGGSAVPGQRGPDSLRGRQLGPNEGLFPGSRAIGRGYAEDIQSALAEPTVSAKIGQGLRATGKAVLAAPLGLAEDILEPWTRALQPATNAAVNTVATAVTGDSAPILDAASPRASRTSSLRVNPDDAFAGPPALAAKFGQPTDTSTAAPNQRSGDVTRVGNSYSGGPNISGDITVNGQTPGGGAISAQNMAAADALAGRETLRSLAGAGASIPGRPAMPAPGNSSNSWQARNDLRNLEVSAKSITNRRRWGGEGSKSADVQAYQRALDADIALRGGMDPGSVARTNATAAMYGDEQRSDAARYASDNSLRGTMASAGATRAASGARLRYDANKDARDFNLRAEEARLKRREGQLKQREASEKNMVDRIAASIPPGPDGKPNTAAAAEQVRAMTARMADRQQQLQAELTQNPDNAQARAELSNILDNGVGAMGLPGMDNFQTGMEAKSLRRENAGWTPWSGKDAKSNKPITSLKLDKGLIWDDYVDDQGGRIPARVVNDRREQFKHLIEGN